MPRSRELSGLVTLRPKAIESQVEMLQLEVYRYRFFGKYRYPILMYANKADTDGRSDILLVKCFTDCCVHLVTLTLHIHCILQISCLRIV